MTNMYEGTVRDFEIKAPHIDFIWHKCTPRMFVYSMHYDVYITQGAVIRYIWHLCIQQVNIMAVVCQNSIY